MRILTVVYGLGPGGTERAAQTYSIAFAGRGHDVAVLSYSEGGPRVANIERAGIPVFVGGPAGKTAAAVERAAAWGPECVHLHRWGMADPATAAILRRLTAGPGRVPVIETNHFARVDRGRDRELIDVHHQTSRWGLWKWKTWCRGLRPAPLGLTIPLLIDTNAFYPVPDEARRFRQEIGLPEDAFAFGRLGQPNPASWSPVVLEAFGRVAAVRPRAHLVLVGIPDSLRGALEQLPTDARGRVKLVPFIHGDDRLRACYTGLDCFLHASQCGETFGMVLAESMLCETPVITLSTPLRGNSQLEVVGHERGGLVVTNGSSMDEAMLRMMDDDDLRARLGEGGRARVERTLDFDENASRFLRLITITAAADSREGLARDLEAEPSLTLRVDRREIRELLLNVMGRVRRRDRVLLELGQVPWLHGAFVRLKRRRRGVGTEAA